MSLVLLSLLGTGVDYPKRPLSKGHIRGRNYFGAFAVAENKRLILHKVILKLLYQPPLRTDLFIFIKFSCKTIHAIDLNTTFNLMVEKRTKKEVLFKKT